MEVSKHAFCVITHSKWEQLQNLIDCIDDDRNDIYLHVDAKSFDEFLKVGQPRTRQSPLYVIDKPISVAWSDVSIADAEVLLFRKVHESGNIYQYIHLLSGTDLPLRSMGQIHESFEDRTEEFIRIGFNPRFIRRLKYYHFL